MATPASLLARHEAITAQYHEHASTVQDIQQQAITDLLPVLERELDWNDEIKGRARAFVEDSVTVFRFSRRARFSLSAALKLLHATLSFRFPSPTSTGPSLSTLSTLTVSSIYLNSPLFFFHPSLHDKFGRPCAVLNLREVRRTEDGQLGALKDFVRLGWEMGRRWLSELSEVDGVKLQMVVIVDLEGAGMSNLEVELLPFFMDLLKSHFPGMVGAIFVLNYGWMYAGMWQLAKRVLPNTALERILFPSTEELLEFFEEDNLLTEHGGHLFYSYTPANPILIKYGSPLPTTLTSDDPAHPYPSPLSSPSPCSTSLTTEVFHSAPSTRPPTPNPNHDPSSSTRPSILTRRPSGLSMTSLKSPSSSSAPSAAPTSPATGLGFSLGSWGRKRPPPSAEQEGGNSLRRVTSFAELQERLAETQKAIMSDDSDLEVDEGDMSSPPFEGEEMEPSGEEGEGEGEQLQPEPERYAASDEEGEGGTAASSRAPSTAATSARSSRATSRNVSRATSREGSPNSLRRRAGGDLGFSSSRAQRFSGTQHLSPYNHSNPYYGYPAFVPSSSLDPSGIPRPHYHRRRKRDLARTLTYLAVLRFLALHRTARAKLGGALQGVLKLLGLSREVGDGGEKRKVHWDESEDVKGKQRATTSSSSAKPTRLTLDQFLPLFLLFLLLRTPHLPAKLRFLVRSLFLRLPMRVLSLFVDGLATMLARVRRVGGAGVGRTRKRDVLRRAVGEAGRRAVEWSESGKVA